MPPRGRGGQPPGRNAPPQAQPRSTGPGWSGSQGWDGAPGWANITSWDEAPGWANVTGWDGAPAWDGAPGWDGAADWGGAPGWGAADSSAQDFSQPPWEGGAPEPNSSFMYREPGPGMPGYRGPGNRYRGGDDLR